MSTWSLPGYEVEQLLGFGASGEVWRARETATGEVVALKRPRAAADPAAVEALRREAALLGSLDTPYVVRLRGVVDGVLVLDHAAGGSLAALLVRRGCLEPGEVVTVAAPLASALAAVHAAGLVHGDVSPANVLFTADGMPLLTDLGAARAVGEQARGVEGTAEYVDPTVARGAPLAPASDVWALGALCHHLLAGTPPHDGSSADQVLASAATGGRAPLGLLAPTAPRALVAVVEAALSDDRAARPSAAALATALQRAQAPAAVRLTGATPTSAPTAAVRETHAVPRPARPAELPAPRRRPSLSALALTGLVLVLLMAGLLWSRAGGLPSARALPAVRLPSPTPTGSAGAVEPAPDWAQVLAGLDDLRAQAFADGAPGLLTKVYARGSAAAAADGAVIAALAAAGERARVRHQVRRVEQSSYTGDRARLRVVDVLGPQQILDAAGRLVQTRPGRGEASYDVDVARQDDGWRISDLAGVP